MIQMAGGFVYDKVGFQFFVAGGTGFDVLQEFLQLLAGQGMVDILADQAFCLFVIHPDFLPFT